jgi:hypothetical protein
MKIACDIGHDTTLIWPSYIAEIFDLEELLGDNGLLSKTRILNVTDRYTELLCCHAEG